MCTIQQPILPCPLCCQPNFSSVDSLRTSLISVTNRPLMCPICNDIVLGLDKLTIHLFSHTLLPLRSELSLQSIEPVISKNVEASSLPAIVATPLFLKIETDSDPVPCAEEVTMAKPSVQPPVDAKVTESLKVVRRRRPKNPVQTSPNLNGDQSNGTGAQLIADTAEQQQHQQQAQCYICGYTFRTKELQRMHLRLVHEIVTIDAVNTADDNMNGGGSGSSPPLINFNRFHCEYCAKYFKMKGSLRLHLRVVHGVYGVAAKAVMNQKSMETGGDKLMLVAQPVASLASAERINQYETVDQGTFDCCAAIAAGLNNSLTNIAVGLESGENPASSDAKQWECDTCAKSFTTKYFLKKHKRLHTGKFCLCPNNLIITKNSEKNNNKEKQRKMNTMTCY